MTATDAYHAGERTVQARAGLSEQASLAARGLKRQIPEVARTFLAQQVALVAGASDEHGHIWASLFTGRPGFVRATGDAALRVAALPTMGDPLRARFTAVDEDPFSIGMIAIEPATRRRMRMNGRAAPVADGYDVTLQQVYSNCPKHIVKRRPDLSSGAVAPGPARTGDRLTTAQSTTIATADTFFIATADGRGHTDASHRGGTPGFVEVVSPTVLRWPDYRGNAMFNTLGNIEVHPAAGLLFPDWETGNCLQLTGTATVDWDPGHAAAIPGAERLVEFTVRQVVEVAGASPLRWTSGADDRPTARRRDGDR